MLWLIRQSSRVIDSLVLVLATLVAITVLMLATKTVLIHNHHCSMQGFSAYLIMQNEA